MKVREMIRRASSSRGAGGERDTRPAPPDSGYRRVGLLSPGEEGKTIQTATEDRARVIGYISLIQCKQYPRLPIGKR